MPPRRLAIVVSDEDMAKTLTELIANLQAQLIDDGTRFTTATCTAALRACLKDVNLRAPINAATRIDAVSNQKEYELTDEDSRSLSILDILKWDDQYAENHTPLSYDAYYEDDRLFFRLRDSLSSGEILARYTLPHTISGLDSETDSTPSAILDQIIVDGACAYALEYRSAARVETINLQQKVSETYKAINSFRTAFELGLTAYLRDRRSPVSQPRTDSWNI